MAAYKQFNSQDIIISPLELTKGFTYLGGGTLATSSISISSSAQYTSSNFYSIERYLGNKFNPTGSTGYNFKITSSEVYNSIQQLYYTNYLSSSNGDVQVMNTASFATDGTIEGLVGSNAYINYDQTDLNPYKYFPTSSYEALTLNQNGSIYGKAIYGVDKYSVSVFEPTIAVMSIPKQLYGDQIQPKSLKITTESGSYFDDGEGRLKRQNNVNSSSIYVGNVIYPHGMVIFTGGSRKEVTGEFSKYGTSYQAGSNSGSVKAFNFIAGPSLSGSLYGSPNYWNPEESPSSGFFIFQTRGYCKTLNITGSKDFYPTFEGTLSSSAQMNNTFLLKKNGGYTPVISSGISYRSGLANRDNNEVINSNQITFTTDHFGIYPGSRISAESPDYSSSIHNQIVLSVTSSNGGFGVDGKINEIEVSGGPHNVPAGLLIEFKTPIINMRALEETVPVIYDQPGYDATDFNKTASVTEIYYTSSGTPEITASGAEYGEDTYGGRLVGTNDINNFAFGNNITCSFSSSFDIYETQYKCTISEDEFNFSQNPSIVSGSKNTGVYLNFATSSFFSPYATTVGMYNEQNELLAVGKLAQPLPLSQTTDTTILVNIDRQ